MSDIMQYAQLLAALATLGAFVYAIVQVQQSKRHKRAEFIIQLHDIFIHDADMMEMFYMIEYGDFHYDEHFHMTQEEKKLDKLLGHFNNICRLHEMKILRDDDIDLMRYEICRVAQNSQVQKYFEWLDYWFEKIGEDKMKFYALRKFAAEN